MIKILYLKLINLSQVISFQSLNVKQTDMTYR